MRRFVLAVPLLVFGFALTGCENEAEREVPVGGGEEVEVEREPGEIEVEEE